jgi:Mrp family chromosome partitioning ATPase
MIETRVRDIRKMLPDGWAADVEDGVIVVTSPELLDEADAVTIAQQFIREIEQPLTLSYTLQISNMRALERAEETASSYGLALMPRGGEMYGVVLKDATPTPTPLRSRVQGRGRKKFQQPETVISVTTTGDHADEMVRKIIDSTDQDDTGVTG